MFRALVITVVAAVMAHVSCVAVAEPAPGPVSHKAEINARTFTTLLHRAKPGERLDFSGKFLAYLDLSDLDFKSAILSGADLYGTDFSRANLSGADLSHTRLDRSTLIRANFSGANLAGATIFRPTVYSDLSADVADAPQFAGANLRNAHFQADLSGASFRGADMTGVDFYPLEARPGTGTLATAYRNVLKYCDFSGARMIGADMRRAIMWFSRFTGADLRGVRFEDADLSRADFSGADLTGANFTRADLDGANLSGAKGLDTAIGLDKAINLDKAIR